MRLLRFNQWYSERQFEFAELRHRSARQIREDAEQELERAKAWEVHEARQMEKKREKAMKARQRVQQELRKLEFGL